MLKRSLTAATTAVALWLAVPALASAATRYATPNPAAGATCAQASPCSLGTALSGASNGDTVIVAPGTYGSTTSPLGPLGDGGKDLTIEGALTGVGRPVLIMQSNVPFGPMFALSGTGSTIQDIEITGTAGDNGLELDGANETANRLLVIESASSNGDACEVFSGTNATILDSLCISHVSGQYSGGGVQSGRSATLRNDTFVGDYGLFDGGTATVVNSILHATGDQDLYALNGSVTLTDCEYSTVTNQTSTVTSTGQVSTAPTFVDAAHDNYRVSSSSAGVDKGQDNSANGQLDLDGDLRTIGAHTDIGAYEVTETPSVTTEPSSGVTTTQATVTGSIVPGGAPVGYLFQYGTTTGYGSTSSPVSLPAQLANESVSATLTGLSPGTQYHYRLVAYIDGTPYAGSDQTFSTSALPAPPGCPAATGNLAGKHLGGIRLGMTRAQARGVYSNSSTRGFRYKDFFCLTPHGIRVGYASPKLLAELPRSKRHRVKGTVVWASTDNTRYSIRGITAGTRLHMAKRRLKHGFLFRVGKNLWYLAHDGKVTAVLKVRHGRVQEIGIADSRLTRTHRADRELMTSFS